MPPGADGLSAFAAAFGTRVRAENPKSLVLRKVRGGLPAAGAGDGYAGNARLLAFRNGDLQALYDRSNGFRFTESDRIRDNREAARRDNNNIYAFLESEGYIRLKADASTSSRELYDLYRLWCDENGCFPMKPRSFSDAMIALAGKYKLEYCNNVTNAARRRVRGFLGIEAVARNNATGVLLRTSVPEGWDD